MKNLIIILFLIVLTPIYSEYNRNDSLKNQITNNYKLEQLKFEILNIKSESIELKEDINIKLKNQKDDLIERMNLYLFFVGLVIILISWVINFFGKTAIIKRIEQLIKEASENYAKKRINEILITKINDEYIAEIIKQKGEPEIERLIKELESKGMQTIKEIKNKGIEVINSVWANPKSQSINSNSNSNSDKQINENKEIIRVKEFFDLAFNTKDPKIKIGLYKSVLELDESNIAALNNIGAAYNEIYEYNKAILNLTLAVELSPNFGLAYANRANSYNQIDDIKNAIGDVDKAIEVEPNLELAYSIKGNILTKQKKYVEAENSLSMAIKLNPESSMAYFNRGYFNEETNRFSESEKDYKKALDLGFENKALLFNNLAVLFRRKKDFDTAIIYINKAKEVNPNFANIDGTLALIYSDLGDDEKFYEYIKIALKKGCPVWVYLSDPGFDKYRESTRLKKIIEPFKNKLS